MTLDKEEHRAFLRAVLAGVQIPGTAARIYVEFADALEAAQVAGQPAIDHDQGPVGG